ncbi:MAG: diaminopimelate decarboxylase family protein [Candidatus Thorarchaeota archaeon]
MSNSDNLFSQQDNSILFDGVNLETEIASVYGTPTYVFSSRKIKENIKEISSAFHDHYPNTNIAYSTKNNMLPEIVSFIAGELDYFETTSLLELKLIEKISLLREKPLNLISTNLYKPDGLIQEIINYPNIEISKSKPFIASGIIAIDSYQDLKNTERVAKKIGEKAKVIIRVNPGIKMSREKTIFASAYPEAKCSTIIGDIASIISSSKDDQISNWLLKREKVPEFDNAEKLIQEASDSDYLDLKGIHGHLGSQVTNIDYFHHFFEVITLFYKIMQEKLGKELEILDLGGGYPVRYNFEEQIPTIQSIAQSLSEKIKKANINPHLIIESGRFITATSALLLTSVNITKDTSSRGKIGILDLSVYSDLLDIITAQWFYDTILVSNLPIQNQQNNTEWELVGATNDTLDQLSPIKKQFPRNLQPGDLLAVKDTGAYTTCFNSNYCGKPKPLAVLLDSENPHKIELMSRV